MARTFAVQLALLGFAARLLVGAISGAEFTSVLTGGLLVLPMFLGLGWLCGWIADLVVTEQAEKELQELLADLGVKTP